MMKTLLKLTGLAFAATVLMAGSVQAAEPPVNVCVSSSGRIVYVQDDGEECRRGYETVTLAIEGPQGEIGDQGEQGEAGPQGEQGEQGEQGLEGMTGDDGSDAADDPELVADLLEIFARLETLEGLHFYEIGDPGPGGGIVFHVTDGGLHGLEAAPAPDQSPGVVWCDTFIDIAEVDNIPDALIPDSQSGAHNTPLIAAACASSAADVAADYELNGVDDWFLPNKEELNLLYAQSVFLGGFVSDFYWSSSEFDFLSAWFQNFASGGQGITSKGSARRVRAVRAF